jgi:Tfp pilus assembly protein PilF
MWLHRFLIIVCLAPFALASGAFAQDSKNPPRNRVGAAEVPRIVAPVTARERQERLDRLFDRLATSASDEDARRFESGIEALWSQSGSDTADLLTQRALELAASEDSAGALTLLKAALEAKPDYAEGWNKRATLFFLKGDYGRAMHDIRETLRHEPRHYGAWAGLGRILEQTGDERRALDAYRRALAINPRIDGLRDQVKKLAEKVQGREI